MAASRRASQFAYQDADGIQARRLSGPPATDGSWSTALLARFVQEWAAARQSGVQFSGAVFWVPNTIDFKPGTPTAANTEAHRPVPTYRTDDGTVLYLRGHESALSGGFPAQALTC